jgi:ABC-type Fe3+/spermidine/putrescine transport system ATPase subunit
MSLRLENLQKTYGTTRAVHRVSLELHQGETLALLGPSGCGKSTLLRLIAGLEPPDGGRCLLMDRDITHLSPQRRGFGMVFQDYALFPHLNVANNIAFGLTERGWERSRQDVRVQELLMLVGLSGYEKRRVLELSGGQQQRVALARALAPNPPVLLLDEPLSNLDLALRDELKEGLRRILGGLDVSAVYVTHDQTEAFTLADRIALMRRGRIIQLDQTADLFARPATVWAARFLGHTNIYTSHQLRGLPIMTGASPHLLLRNDLVLLGSGDVTASISHHTQTGALHVLELSLHPHGLPFRWSGLTRELPERLEVGGTVRLLIPPDAVVPLEADQEEVQG